MANAAVSEHFSRLEADICSTFDTLKGLLDKRKSFLLEELHTLRKEFYEKHQTIFSKLKGLEDSNRELQNLLKDLKGNEAVERMNSSIAELNKEILDLTSQLPKLSTVFNCDLPTIQNIINNKVVLLTVAPRKLSRTVTLELGNTPIIPTNTGEQIIIPKESDMKLSIHKGMGQSVPPKIAKKPSVPSDTGEPFVPMESDMKFGIHKGMSQSILPKIADKSSVPCLTGEPFVPMESKRKLTLPRKLTQSNLSASDISKVIKFGPKQDIITYPNGICVHNESNRVLICDNSGKVHVCSLDGDYLFEFGGEILKNPYGVVILNNFIFVTDMGKSSILKFTIDNYCLVTSSITAAPEYTHTPDYICSDGREIFVSNNVPSISVFTCELQLVRTLETKQLGFTTGIVAHRGCLFILEFTANIIYLLNSETGSPISQIPTNKDSANFTHANNFCIDSDCNFLITDLKSHLIKKIGTYGSCIKTIDTGAMECYQPNAIVVTDSNKVVVTFRSGKQSILLFDSF